ncbi:diacylglycerol O-acyltransferase [Lipomyces japonicus]|uniref:diacylglycerol O-acyltransferase n=1 Tax=Lipomyces japonicus TaxID=56871 RepID=UPI0034CD6776
MTTVTDVLRQRTVGIKAKESARDQVISDSLGQGQDDNSSLRRQNTIDAATKIATTATVTAKRTRRSKQLNHVYPIHHISRASILSRDSVARTPSFVGFRNLAMIVLVVSNLRLVVENYKKYGVLISFSRFDMPRQDFAYAMLLTGSIPLHLFIALVIERTIASAAAVAAAAATTKTAAIKRYMWHVVVLVHSINVACCVLVTTWFVYYKVYHPVVGTACEIHAVIVGLKVASYALTNRDLREAAQHKRKDRGGGGGGGGGDDDDDDDDDDDEWVVPEFYRTAPYPDNLTVSNLCYFWWAPTLVYQPVYPRSGPFRLGFFMKRVAEVIACGVVIWFLSAQYAVPTLQNSLVHFNTLAYVSLTERLMKLATVSMAIWLTGFFCVFQSGLNGLAEAMRFGDREFYDDWWNSTTVGEYWKLWNKPVTNYFRRHMYGPLVRSRGWSPVQASAIVFTVSAVLHELAVGVPTHNVIGVAFASMMLQIPLAVVTAPLAGMPGRTPATIGNCVFWVSFFMGQPLGVLLYYFAWSAKYVKE